MNKKTIITTLLVLLVAFGGLTGYSLFLADKPVEGEKQITLTITAPQANHHKEYTHQTSVGVLGDALAELDILEAEDSQFGRYIIGLDGVSANEAKQQWWKVLQNGADAPTGIDETMIQDGDTYEFILMDGWGK